MDQRGDEVHVSETEASGGSKEGVVRWVLIIGTLLAIGLLTIIWTSGALIQDDGPDSEYNVSNEIAAGENADKAQEGEPIPPAFGEEAAEPDSNQAPDADPRRAPLPVTHPPEIPPTPLSEGADR
jgi:hypothetical protein